MNFPYKNFVLFMMIGVCHVTHAQERGAKTWPNTWTGEGPDHMPCVVGYSSTPRDYRDRSAENVRVLRIVETYHFDQFANGTRPRGSGFGDLDYTLAWFPNHHKALFTVIRLATESSFTAKAAGQNPFEVRPECRLGAAEHLFPDDGDVQFLFGLYFHRTGRLDDALERYSRGVALKPNGAEGHYNFGLLLLEMNRPEEAREHAKKAYSLGYPLLGLKRKLEATGHPL